MKLKHIAAAAALVAVSVPSFAALTLGNANDNPEFVVFLLDRTAQVSYALDLGLGLTDFNQNGTYTYALNSANFSSFLTAAGGAGGLEFAVYAGENNGTTAAGQRNILTTVTAGSTVALTNTSVNTAIGNTSSFFGDVINNSTGSTLFTATNGDGWAAAGNSAYFLTVASDKFNVPAISFTNTNVEGTAASFYKLSNSSTSNGAAATVTQLAGVWTLSQTSGGAAYSLQYSAVPDADGLALVLAGLGAMGFVARRRAR